MVARTPSVIPELLGLCKSSYMYVNQVVRCSESGRPLQPHFTPPPPTHTHRTHTYYYYYEEKYIKEKTQQQ